MADRFKIEYTTHAAKAIRKLDRTALCRVLKTIEILSENPQPPAGTQLVGGDGQWRVRTGDYRIIYEIDKGRLVVLAVKVGHRREIYR